MNNIYYITGTSSGIGKAIAETLLENESSKVYGISRSQTIEHKNYVHINCDLSIPEKVDEIVFKEESCSSIVLINNAGAITDVKYVGQLKTKDIVHDYNINTIAPAILINKFIKTYQSLNAQKTILNISSGASKYAVDGWGVYCSSKSALNLFSEVVALEQFLHPSGFKIYSVAPGIVDTKMQDQIRAVNESDFSRLDEFIEYKKTGKLVSAELAAKKIISILDNTQNYKETVFSLRDLN